MEPTYESYRRAVADRSLPLAFVDLDMLDRNVEDILRRARGRRIRVASKSIRSVAILRRLLAAHETIQGVLCFSAKEAAYLAAQGFDDLVVAYPTIDPDSLRAVATAVQDGKHVSLMVDSIRHVRAIETEAERAGTTLPVSIDIDLSLRIPGLFFGALRSPLRTPESVVDVYRVIEASERLRFDGVLGYESQIAGVPDAIPGNPLKSWTIRGLKRLSIPRVKRQRAAILAALEAEGAKPRFVNGGGTGSVESTVREDAVDEVTVGSGFYAPALFDGFKSFRHLPAAGFALEVVRRPKPGVYTCAGGGYIASGVPDGSKAPTPSLPEGLRLTGTEGAGEVQTPLITGTMELEIGAPVFFRHAKAGELCERFDRLLLVLEGRIVDEVTTYRGDGVCFF